MRVITKQDLERNFGEVALLDDGSFKFEDRLPGATYFYHARLGADASSHDLLTVSIDVEDDEFSSRLLRASLGFSLSFDALTPAPIANNKYGFEQVIFAPPSYHKFMKGRLDSERSNLFLCVPCFVSEFSGDESVDEFEFMRRSSADALKWNRTIRPKISMRVDNPSTGVSIGSGYALVSFDELVYEVSRLKSGQGFVEVLNFRGTVRDVVAQPDDVFALIRDRDDSRVELLALTELRSQLWEFVIQA
jgi:hypothetical protein